MGSINLYFLKSENDLILTLTQPDGNAIDLNDPNVTHVSGATYEAYKIFAPKHGTWTMSISSASGGEYTVSASTTDAMILSVSADKDKYVSGDSIKIMANIEDSVSASPTSPEYIFGAVMQVTVENPTLDQSTFVTTQRKVRRKSRIGV